MQGVYVAFLGWVVGVPSAAGFEQTVVGVEHLP